MSRALIAALLALLATPAFAENPVAIGLTPFTFADTSGEVRDQAKLHSDRLARMGEVLEKELASNDQFAVAKFSCGNDPCPADELLPRARDSGKRYVVVGAVQKTSTLVLWATVDVLDAATGKTVLHRWITFRGDTDEAWDRTARFIGKAINTGFAG
ncbi:MAG TPA: DUF2380 domain-containing protein [Mesorhizobium sp.]